MTKGTIIKGIGGFYYVDTGDSIIECKARGHFRNKKLSPCVGDLVDISVDKDNIGSIEKIYERRNYFIRPPVSNINEMIIVASICNPAPDLTFIDKMLVIAQANNVDVKICFNKLDLDDGSIKAIADIYINAGYEVYITSTLEDVGINAIRNSISGKIVAFSGFSGVGKSSLLNAVVAKECMQTGEVSNRLQRGKHTTRHVELISFNGGYIVDTPGFSMLDFPDSISKEDLADYFPEFDDYSDGCKFRNCNHMGNSSVCAVCKAVGEGSISSDRFNNYKSFYNILSHRKEWEK